MEKFIKTAKNLMLTQQQRAFHKMLDFMKSYAQCCRDMITYKYNTEEGIGFTLALKGLVTRSTIVWQAELIALCEKAYDALASAFETKAQFHEVLGGPLKADPTIETKEMEKILDVMAGLIERRHAELFPVLEKAEGHSAY